MNVEEAIAIYNHDGSQKAKITFNKNHESKYHTNKLRQRSRDTRLQNSLPTLELKEFETPAVELINSKLKLFNCLTLSNLKKNYQLIKFKKNGKTYNYEKF